MKIANKIRLSLLTVSLILTTISGTIFYWVAKDGLQKSIYNNLAATVASRCDHIETYLKILETSVGQLSKSVVLENLLKINDKEGPQQNEAFAVAMKRLKRTKEADPAIAEFMLLDVTGKVVASSKESNVGLDISTDSIFLGGQKESYIKDVYYSEVHKKPLMAVSTPFLDSQTGELLGVLVARVRLNELNNIVAHRVGMGDTGEIYIVNKYGYMITPFRFKEDAVLKQRVDTEQVQKAWLHKDREHVLPKDKRVDVFPDYRGVPILVTHGYIPQMQWAVLAEIDAKEALAPLAKIRLFFLPILFIVSIAAWLLGNIIAKVIAGPINRLSKGAEIIGSGNLDYKVGTDAKDEVGQLSRAFDAMIGDLQKTAVSKNYFDNIIGSMTDSLIVIDPDAKIATVNKATCALLGYEEEELIGKDVSLLFPEEEEPFRGTKLQKLIKEGSMSNYEVNFKTKDGNKIPVLLSGAVMRRIDCPNEGPIDDCPEFKKKGMHCEKLQGIVAVAKDITERKKVEDALWESENKYRTLLENLPQKIFMKDRNSVFISCNENYVRNLKIKPDAIAGKTDYEFYPKELAEKYRNDDKRIMDSGKTAEIEEKYIQEGKELIVHTVKTPIKDEQGNVVGILGIFWDITERKKAEEQQKQLMKDLEEKKTALEKTNTELDDFTYMVSHDLKEPLRSIDAFSKFIEDDYKDRLDEEGRNYVERIRINASRMQELIDDLLDISRIERKKNPIEEVEAEELVNEARLRLEYGIEKKSVEIDIRNKLPKVFCDKVRLAEVFLNLISNAIKFNDKPNPIIEIGCNQKDIFYEFYVKDNGPGIEEQYFDKIFEIFQRLVKKEDYEGSGAGLTIAKKIVVNAMTTAWQRFSNVILIRINQINVSTTRTIGDIEPLAHKHFIQIPNHTRVLACWLLFNVS